MDHLKTMNFVTSCFREHLCGMSWRNLISCLPVAFFSLILVKPAAAQSVVTCSSDDGGRHYCSADTSRGVRMGRQRSGSPCREGDTWGYDRRGIWVDKGCRADFVLDTGGRGDGGRYRDRDDYGRDRDRDRYRDRDRDRDDDRDSYRDRDRGGSNSGSQVITCSSDDGRRHYCNADIRRGVELGRQRSGSPCRQGDSWGYDRRGIWVDRGCRADFIVR
jgi:hypothetical protein